MPLQGIPENHEVRSNIGHCEEYYWLSPDQQDAVRIESGVLMAPADLSHASICHPSESSTGSTFSVPQQASIAYSLTPTLLSHTAPLSVTLNEAYATSPSLKFGSTLGSPSTCEQNAGLETRKKRKPYTQEGREKTKMVRRT